MTLRSMSHDAMADQRQRFYQKHGFHLSGNNPLDREMSKEYRPALIGQYPGEKLSHANIIPIASERGMLGKMREESSYPFNESLSNF